MISAIRFCSWHRMNPNSSQSKTIEVEGGHYMSNPSITDFQNYMMEAKSK